MKTNKLKLSLNMILVLTLALSIALPCMLSNATASVAYAADSSSYYSSITATSGTALLGQLHDLMIDTHTTYSTYADCSSPSIIKKTDAGKASGKVMEFYTQADMSSTWSSGASGTWNREHVWPKSLSNGLWSSVSNSDRGAGADLHHIRPAETDLNNARGNQPYGKVTNGSPKYATGISGIIGGYSNGSVFEPTDNVKGDVARIVMYVYTHYNAASRVNGTKDNNSYTNGNLPITKIISAGGTDNAWALLLEWNKLDPVDDIERKRNEAVYEIQGNRNPFIDNESYADAIWGTGTVTPVDPVDPVLTALTLTPKTVSLKIGATQTLTVKGTPSNANAAVTWSSSNTSVATVSSSGVVTAVASGSATITATSTKNASIKATATVTVQSDDPVDPVLTALTITPNTLSLTVGDKQSLSVTTTPANVDAVVGWTTSNPYVASVNSSGVVTATGAGSAIITVTSVKNPTVKASVTVTVSAVTSKVATAIQLIGSPANTQYEAGQTFNPLGLIVNVTYNDGTTTDYTSQGDLNQFVWVDALTNQTTLSTTTTTIKCKLGALECTGVFTITVIAPVDHISGFVAAVDAISETTALEDKFDAIKTAIRAYGQLTSTEKEDATAKNAYQKLLNAVNNYNADVASRNEVLTKAAASGCYAVCSATLAAAALVAVLKRKFN